MTQFSILDEPWIPVRDRDGRLDEMSLRDVVLRANDLLEITDGSPIIEYGLYRLVITFFMDMLRAEDTFELSDILDEGRVDQAKLEQYLSQCEQEGVSFDLFSSDRPFLQTPYRAQWDKTKKPASQLDYTLPHGTSHVHFDHRDMNRTELSYAEAARMLPAIPLFCAAAAQGYPSGVNGKPPYYAIVRGRNLFETLVLSMITMDDVSNFDSSPPWWRSTEEVEPKQVIPQTSLLYGMLFPARRVLLLPSNGTVREVYFSQGMNFKNVDLWHDPHVAYRITDKGRFPWSPRSSGQPIWMNIMQLVRPEARPLIVSHAAEALQQQEMSVQLYGVETDQAKYIDSVRHDLRIPVALLHNLSAMGILEEAVGAAVAVGNALRRSLDSEKVPQIPSACAPAAEAEYYRMIERAFWQLVTALSTMDSSAELNETYRQWIDYIVRCAWRAYNKAFDSCRFRLTELEAVYAQRKVLAGTAFRYQHPEQVKQKKKEKTA